MMMKMNNSHLVPFAILLFSAAIYSMTLSLNRIAITEGIPVFAFVFWQCLGAALLAFVAAVATRQLPSLRRKDFRLYLLLGTFGTAVPYTLIVFVAPKVPAGAIGLGLTLVPILTYGIAVIFRIDRIRLLRIAGFLFGLAGVLLVLLPDQSLPEPGMAPWLLMAFGAPLCWAFCHVGIAILRPPESQPIPLTCGVFTCASIIMLPVMAVTENWWVFDSIMTDGDWALIGTIVIIPIVYALTFVLIQMLGPVLFSTIGYFGTLIGLGWAALYFGEVPSPWIWAAITILFLGLFLVNRTSKPSSI